MTEEKAVTIKRQDAPVEWGKRGEIAALADRFAVMLPNAKEMTREEVLTAAQYARMMDLNPFRGEVYFYKSRGKLCVVDGYKALARWARKEQPYTDRYDMLPTDNGELVKMRCWILREDRKPFIREYVDMGATFQEAFEIAATYADGVVMVSETFSKKTGDPIDPPVGWTWEQVARKRAFKNAINLSHGAPSPREIAQLSWEVNGVQTAPADWDDGEVLTQEEIERLAELRARTREALEAFNEMPAEEQAAKVAKNSRQLYGNPEFEGFDTPTTTTTAPVWDADIVTAGEDEPEPEPTPAPRPNSKVTNGHREPLDPETVRKFIRQKAGNWNGERNTAGEPVTEKQIPYVATLMGELFPNLDNQLAQKARHDVLRYLIGVDSTHNLMKGEASAIIDWINKDQDAARIEAARILEATAIEAGQQALDLPPM